MLRLRRSLISLVKKAISLMVIFNSVVTLVLLVNTINMLSACAVLEKLCNSYTISIVSNVILFFSVVLTSILNIASARIMGKVNIRRILFHHYIYGFLSIALYLSLSLLPLIIHHFIQLSPLSTEIFGNQPLLTPLLYFGITLIIDDISDVSPRIARCLRTVKDRVHKLNRLVFWTHSISSLISAYAALIVFLRCIGADFSPNTFPCTAPSHLILSVNLLIAAAHGIKSTLSRMWLKYL